MHCVTPGTCSLEAAPMVAILSLYWQSEDLAVEEAEGKGIKRFIKHQESQYKSMTSLIRYSLHIEFTNYNY